VKLNTAVPVPPVNPVTVTATPGLKSALLLPRLRVVTDDVATLLNPADGADAAVTDQLWGDPAKLFFKRHSDLVGARGLEPPTSAV
jgi:hypothetical protein